MCAVHVATSVGGMSTAQLERTAEPRLDTVGAEWKVRSPAAVSRCEYASNDTVATLVPGFRSYERDRAAVGRRRVQPFDPCASATAWIVVEGLAACGRAAAAEIVAAWSDLPQPSAPLAIVDGGCDVRAGQVRIDRALRASLLRWLPLTETDIALYENGLFGLDPAGAVTLLVRPPTVWSLAEALLAESSFPRDGPRFDPLRFVALERHARSRVGRREIVALRRAASWIDAQLPLAGFPRASALVAAGCAVILSDDGRCAEIAARQLARYATSAVVRAEADR